MAPVVDCQTIRVDVSWASRALRRLRTANAVYLVVSILAVLVQINTALYDRSQLPAATIADWVTWTAIVAGLILQVGMVWGRSNLRFYLKGTAVSCMLLICAVAGNVAQFQSGDHALWARIDALVTPVVLTVLTLALFLHCMRLLRRRFDGVGMTLLELRERLDLLSAHSLRDSGSKASGTGSIVALLMNISAFWLWALIMSGLVLYAIWPPEGAVLPGWLETSRDALLALFGTAFVFQPATRLIANGWWRLSARDASALLEEDRRALVLYLRSFKEETHQIPTGPLLVRMATFGLHGRQLLEHIVEKIYAKAAPMIAIGDPREMLKPLGAGRIYVPNDEWQATVLAWIERARAIVLMVGKGPWLAWEIGRVAEKGRLAQLILMFPRTKEDRQQVCAELLAAIAETDFGRRLSQARLSDAILIFSTGDDLVIVESQKPHSVDYEIAATMAVIAMLAGLPSSTLTSS